MTPTLRPVKPGDPERLFELQRDPEAHRMAAFTHLDPDDRDGYLGWWGRILGKSSVVARAIEVDGELVGSVLSWSGPDGRELAYWLGRAWWGRGVTTAALKAMLAELDARPLLARVASDNVGSVRVLQKCGFVEVERMMGFAGARGEEIEETVYRLD